MNVRHGIALRDIMFGFLTATTRINPVVLKFLPGGWIIPAITPVDGNDASGDDNIEMRFFFGIISVLSAAHAFLISLVFVLFGMPVLYSFMVALFVFGFFMVLLNSMVIRLPSATGSSLRPFTIASVHETVKILGYENAKAVYGIIARVNGCTELSDDVRESMSRTAAALDKRLVTLREELRISEERIGAINRVIAQNRLRYREEVREADMKKAADSPEFSDMLNRVMSMNVDKPSMNV